MPKRQKTNEIKPATVEELQTQVDDLLEQAKELKAEVSRFQKEKDILEMAAEVIKKMRASVPCV